MIDKPPFVLRRASDALASRVAATAANEPEAPRWGLSAWHAMCGDPQHRCLLVACEAEEIRGWVGGSCCDGTAELETLLVVPASRRRGLAMQLLEGWMAWARVQGATECLLEVRASNRAALAVYEVAGFAVDGRRRRYYEAPVEDALLLRRALVQEVCD